MLEKDMLDIFLQNEYIKNLLLETKSEVGCSVVHDIMFNSFYSNFYSFGKTHQKTVLELNACWNFYKSI